LKYQAIFNHSYLSISNVALSDRQIYKEKEKKKKKKKLRQHTRKEIDFVFLVFLLFGLFSSPPSPPSSFFYLFFLPIIATIGNCENTHTHTHVYTEHHTHPYRHCRYDDYSLRILLNDVNHRHNEQPLFSLTFNHHFDLPITFFSITL
jgi:hypothetical protein